MPTTERERGRRFGRCAGSPAALVALLLMVVSSGAVLGALSAPAGATTSAPSWIPAEAVLPTTPAPQMTGLHAVANIKASTCPAPGFCVAAGTYRLAGGGLSPTTFAPYVEVYSGGAWSLVTVPMPSTVGTGTQQNVNLNDVVCAGPDSCEIVGQYEDIYGRMVGLIETLSGAKLKFTVAPEPADGSANSTQWADLASVSCPALGSCTAVGRYENTTDGYQPLIETLSNGVWTPAAGAFSAGLPQFGGVTGTLSAVSCPAVGSCSAVGQFANTTTGHPGLLETLSGGLWKATEAPEPPGFEGHTTQAVKLSSVSCPAVGSCVAVGIYTVSPDDKDGGLIETLSNGTWQSVAATVPAGGGGPVEHLSSVTCPVTGRCTAVGTYESSTNATFSIGLIETLSGGSWTSMETPAPANEMTGVDMGSDLVSVSCSAPGSCAAVGEYRSDVGRGFGLIDQLTGSSWTSTQAPQPSSLGTPNPLDSVLYTVACAGGGCVAAGGFGEVTVGDHGLLESFNMAPSGYFEAASDGGIFAFTVPFHGSMGGKPLNAPIVAAVADPLTGGYYEVASDGGIFAFTAPFQGSMGGKPLNEPIVGMAFDTRTGGYYLVASDGGLFAFTAPFHGSMGGKPLNEPIVGMAFDPATGGYWEVASDGGLFSFTAPFLGSMGGKPLVKPIVSMTYDSLTNGYYEVASDGGLFSFGAPFEGSMGGRPLNEPVVNMAFDYGTGGYWEVASDGGLFSFTAPFQGSMGGKPLNEPIIGMALG